MTTRNDYIAPAVGLVVGLLLGYVDSRPTWDDTGVTAVAVFCAAALIVSVRPSLFWLTGLAVSVPILVMNVVVDANYGSAIALVIGLVGSVVGYQLHKLFGLGGPSRRGA